MFVKECLATRCYFLWLIPLEVPELRVAPPASFGERNKSTAFHRSWIGVDDLLRARVRAAVERL